jgi:hypothetical protein
MQRDKAFPTARPVETVGLARGGGAFVQSNGSSRQEDLEGGFKGLKAEY